MRNIFRIAVALLILAAALPASGQEWNRVNDTTYVRYTIQSNGVLTEYAEPVDMEAHIMKLNNDLRSASLLQACSLGAGAAACAIELVNISSYGGKSSSLNTAGVILGLASMGLYIGSVCKTHQRRVYMGPDGVVIRITRTDAPKYDNRKKIGWFK